MTSRCPGLIVAALVIMVAACAPAQTTTALYHGVGTADFEAAITRLDQHGPQSPEAFNARLEYADFLSQSADGDCRQRLAAAQAQLDLLTANPATQVMLPLGAARLAAGAYKIHAARAGCDSDAAAKSDDLRQALAAAERATELYRDALDYQSSAIMQFNVAVTDHAMGNEDAALVALDAAVAMDRTFGFRQDAQDNIKLMLDWKKQPDGDSAVANVMKDFPDRSTQLHFSWSAGDANLVVDASDTAVVDAKIIHNRGAVTLKRHVGDTPRGWTVSYEAGAPTFDLGAWPAREETLRSLAIYFLSSALLQVPTIQVSKDGDFIAATDAAALGASLSGKVSAQIDENGAPSAQQGFKSAFSQDFVAAKAAQDYGLETAAWIGAKLQQGAWYQMSAQLFLPGLGMGQFVVTHDVQFSYARPVACMAGAASQACVEIVVHATPDADDLNSALRQSGQQVKLPAGQSVHYWSTMDMRLIVDPNTLAPYLCDVRQSWFDALDGIPASEPVIRSTRIVSAFTY